MINDPNHEKAVHGHCDGEEQAIPARTKDGAESREAVIPTGEQNGVSDHSLEQYQQIT